MKMRRSLITPGALSLGVAVLASMVSASPANAQTAVPPGPIRSISTSSASTTPAATVTAAQVPIRGIVIDRPESVVFSGLAQVNTKVVTDPDLGNWPTTVVTIDLGDITGVGSFTRKMYVASGSAVFNRSLSAADTVQLTFPYSLRGDSTGSSHVGLASFDLSFNVDTMKLTGVTARIDNARP